MVKRKGEWEEVGTIGVDAGLCWIGDPCYCVTPDASSHPARTWDEFCDILSEQDDSSASQWSFANGIRGLGVCVSTGWGDGEYPVYVRRNPEGRVAEVKVVFIE